MESSFDVVLIKSSSELFTCSLDVGEGDFLVWLGFFFCYFCCSFFSSVVLFDCLHDEISGVSIFVVGLPGYVAFPLLCLFHLRRCCLLYQIRQ